MDAFLTLFLQLPLGILFAAGLLECFVVFKDRRDAEPAVLWLLFCASIMALICGGVHFLQHGSWDYSLFVGLASGLTAIGWWFKRSGRNRVVLWSHGLDALRLSQSSGEYPPFKG